MKWLVLSAAVLLLTQNTASAITYMVEAIVTSGAIDSRGYDGVKIHEDINGNYPISIRVQIEPATPSDASVSVSDFNLIGMFGLNNSLSYDYNSFSGIYDAFESESYHNLTFNRNNGYYRYGVTNFNADPNYYYNRYENFDVVSFTVSAPETSTWILLLIGFVGLAGAKPYFRHSFSPRDGLQPSRPALHV